LGAVPVNDEVAIEAIREVLGEHTIECTGIGEVTCRACRERSWMSWSVYRAHVAEIAGVAAAAQVRARIATDIEAEKAVPPFAVGDRTFNSALSRAARIARGDAP
jgi:hypothetical protein